MIAGVIIGHSSVRQGADNDKTGMTEWLYNRELALMVVSNLSINFKVIGRDGLIGSYGRLIANVSASRVDFFVSLHANAFDEFAHGTETLYADTSKKSAILAGLVQTQMCRGLGLKDRGLKPRTIKKKGGPLLHRTPMPGVIVEPFFIDNDLDLARANLRKIELAKGLVKGIENFAEYLEGV
jgi:N-acetylmuramoyl-L-alanine amidase